MADELWDRTIAINLTGTYHCMRARGARRCSRAGSGRVINIASSAGKVGYPYTAAYVASKHGVLGLTRAVALEAARYGRHRERDLPGLDRHRDDRRVRSRASSNAPAGRPRRRGRSLEAMNPQGRLIEPEEVAEVAGASRIGGRRAASTARPSTSE